MGNAIVKNEVLTQDTFKTVAQHPNPKVLNNTLNLLLENELLTQGNFKAVVEHQNPEALASALNLLASKNFLCEKKKDFSSNKQNIVDQVINHQDTKNLDSLLKTRSDALLLNKDNFSKVIDHPSVRVLNSLFETIKTEPLFTEREPQDPDDPNTKQHRFETILKHKNPEGLANGINKLHEYSLLVKQGKQNNFTDIIAHKNPESLANALAELKCDSTIPKSPETIKRIIASENPFQTFQDEKTKKTGISQKFMEMKGQYHSEKGPARAEENRSEETPRAQPRK